MVDTNEFFFEDLQVAVSKIELVASSKLLVEAANDL